MHGHYSADEQTTSIAKAELYSIGRLASVDAIHRTVQPIATELEQSALLLSAGDHSRELSSDRPGQTNQLMSLELIKKGPLPAIELVESQSPTAESHEVSLLANGALRDFFFTGVVTVNGEQTLLNQASAVQILALAEQHRPHEAYETGSVSEHNPNEIGSMSEHNTDEQNPDNTAKHCWS